ncbi:MAG: Gfo/Idh/MocA family oxidoreductase [Acidimicrobiia bacterium]
MSTPMGVGVIGLGMFGRLHCRAVAEHHRLTLATVFDTDSATAAEVAGTWNARAARDLQDLVRDPSIEAVIVCTPEDRHVEPVRAALEAGKHVLVEKPLTTESASAAALAELAERNRLVLLVGHILRFDPRYVHAREAVASGRLGPLGHIWARRNNPRSAARRVGGRVSLVFYLGIHDIDAALWIAGDAPESVFARSSAVVNRDLGVEDGLFALLRLAGGAVVSLESSWAMPEQLGSRVYGGLDVVGRDGMVKVDLDRPGLYEVGANGSNAIDPNIWPVVNGRLEGDLVREVDHFARCVLDGATPIVPSQDAVTAVRVAEAILRSARTEEVVRL